MSNNMFIWNVWKPWFTFLLRYQHTYKEFPSSTPLFVQWTCFFLHTIFSTYVARDKNQVWSYSIPQLLFFEGGISQNSWIKTLSLQKLVNYFQGGNPKWLSCIIFELHFKIHYCHANLWSCVCVRYDIDVCVLHIKILS